VNNGFVVGLIIGVADGIGFNAAYLVVLMLRTLFPVLDSQNLGSINCIAFYVALGLGFLTARVTNKAWIKRGIHGLGYRGVGIGRGFLGIIGVVISGLPLFAFVFGL